MIPATSEESLNPGRPQLGKGLLATFASGSSFVFSYLLVTILHEGGHYFIVRFYSRPSVLFTNHVNYDYTSLSTAQNIRVAMGGLAVSLAIWLASFFIKLLVGKVNGTFSVLLFWLCLWATVSLWGYVYTAAFPVYGDLSYICIAFGLSIWRRVIISMVGMAVFYFSIAALLPEAKKIMGACQDSANALFLYPVLWGTLCIILFSLPTNNFFLLMYPAFSIFYIFPFYFDAKRKNLTAKPTATFSISLAVLFFLLTALVFISLKPGIQS